MNDIGNIKTIDHVDGLVMFVKNLERGANGSNCVHLNNSKRLTNNKPLHNR